ncbi:MAG: polyribonucleotide nucleotidyltransferase, partial [Bacteroidetes bacterium SW_10_40_5]
VDEENEQGVVEIMSDDKESLDKAKDRIEKMIESPEEGKVYTGFVKSIMPFGAFVEFLPGTDGLVHISEIAWERTESMDGIFEEGQEVQVKLKEIDKKTGKYALTMKELLPKPDGFQEPSKSPKKDKRPHKEKPKRE